MEGILNFAERVLPRASDHLDSGVVGATAAASATVFPGRYGVWRKSICSTRRNIFCLRYLRPSDASNENLVDQNSASWNRVVLWMRQLESLSRAS